MTKISNTGPGGSRPIGGPDSTENIKETGPADESTKTSTSSTNAESASTKEVAGDKYAAGDLKAAGNRLKSHLDSELQSKKPDIKKDKDVSKEKELARQLEQHQPHFAPPYVPVGPVVMGDNIAVPNPPQAPSGATKGLTPEQVAKEVAKHQPHFAPPYVPVGPVVMGDNISVPAPPPGSGEIRQMNLMPDQFQINPQGNLVITNEKLIDFFKSLKENATGKEILLGIMNMKPPGEE